MYDLILPQKHPDEVLTITFPFQSLLPFGEVITGAGVAAGTFLGLDPSPEDIIFGVPTVTPDGYNVEQVIVGGVPGTIYNLLCTANSSGSNVFTKVAKLAVIRPVEAFTGA